MKIHGESFGMNDKKSHRLRSGKEIRPSGEGCLVWTVGGQTVVKSTGFTLRKT